MSRDLHADRVELSIPATVEWLLLARTTGAAIASRWSFTYDEIADLKLAIDEFCLTLVEGPGAERLDLAYYLENDSLCLEGRTVLATPGSQAASDSGATGAVTFSADLSARILDALVDEHGISDGPGDGAKTAWLRKKRNPLS
jgi:hypothetical protein